MVTRWTRLGCVASYERRLANGMISAPGNATRSALGRSATSIASMPAGTRPASGGTSAWVKPSRAASARRREVPVTRSLEELQARLRLLK